jgi:hypothetical protein
MAELKRLYKYPSLSQVQRKSGHVHIKDQSGGWPRLARVLKANELGRELEANEKVFHIDGNPNHNIPSNLVVIRFSGTRYRLAKSRPLYIPKEDSHGRRNGH